MTNETMKDGERATLRPCPFCGSEAQMIHGDGPFDGRVQIDCTNCRNATWWWAEAVAVRMWNARAASQQSGEKEEIVKWQFRDRRDGDDVWSEWMDCPTGFMERNKADDGYQFRPLYARALIAAQASQAPTERRSDVWIAVADILPRDGELVCVFDPDHPELKVWPAQWDAKNQCFTAGSHKSAGWFERDEVTHWIPLPDAPTAARKSEIDRNEGDNA